jgi:hypothetical protein
LEAENDDIGPENTYLWDVKAEYQYLLLARPRLHLDLLIDSIYVSHRLGDGLERFVQNLLLETDIRKEVIHPPFVREPKY